jgi:hypothetical protein
MGNQSFLAGSTLSLSSDAARIAVGTAPSTLHIYDVEEKRAFVNYPLGSLVANLRGLAFARDKSHLLFVAGDGSLHVFDYLDLKEGGGLGKRLSFALTCVAVSPLGTEYVTGGEDKLVRFWDMATGKELREAKGHTERVNAVAFGPDRRAVSASDDKTVRLWDAKTGHELQRFTWHTDAVTSVAISADGRYAISGGADKTVRLWGLPK